MLIGIDPGLANMGVCIRETGDSLCTVHVLSSKRNPTIGLRADKLERAKLIAKELDSIFAVAALRAKKAKVTVIAEEMTWPRSAGASIMIALSWGLVVAQCQKRNWELVTVSPGQLKLAATGIKNATKTQVIAAADKAVSCMARINKTKKEHAADAWAATKAYERDRKGTD